MDIAEFLSCVVNSYRIVSSDRASQPQKLLSSVHLPKHHIYRLKVTFNPFIFKGLHKYKHSQPLTPVKLISTLAEVCNKTNS